MPTKLMTYDELADAWSVSREAARKKVEGLRLPRQTGNDGKARVMVDLEEVQHKPLKKRDRTPPGDHPEAEALREHIVTLQAEIQRLILQAETARTDFERERDRADRENASAVESAARLIEAESLLSRKSLEMLTLTQGAMRAAIERDEAKAALAVAKSEIERVAAAEAKLRSRPWWKRLVG
jgi:hypothetical protein